MVSGLVRASLCGKIAWIECKLAPEETMPKYEKIRQSLARRRAADLRQAKRKNFCLRQQRRRELFRRKRMVEQYRSKKKMVREKDAVREVGSTYACSPSLVRHYDRLWRKEGLCALMPRSRAPHHPHRQLTVYEIGLIVAVRVLTGWGSQRIARNLKSQSQGEMSISHTTVWRVICRHHLPRRVNHPRGKKDGIVYQRYQRGTRNSLWHLDYKTTPLLLPGTQVSILVIIDDSTRYCLAAKAYVGHATTDWAVEVLQECFQCYGRPKQLLTDNDRIFVGGANRPPADGTLPYCRFRQAIVPTELLTTAPYYPQCNGKAEALIRTFWVECLALECADRNEAGFANVDQVQSVLDEFARYYNFHREHSALEYQTPVSRYLGKKYASLGFASVPRLKHLPMPFPKLDEAPNELSAYEIQRCFAVAKVQ